MFTDQITSKVLTLFTAKTFLSGSRVIDEMRGREKSLKIT